MGSGRGPIGRFQSHRPPTIVDSLPLPFSGMVDKTQTEILQFIRRVMPNATVAELREATANFDEYMDVVREIFERIKREPGDSDSQHS
jgi:hypothetical protein